MNESSRLPLILRVLFACVALAAIGTATAAAEKRVQFNIAPQDLLTALNEFAQQSDQELLFSTDVAAYKRTDGVTGEFPPAEALRALLEGTGLEYRVTSENTILIERTGEDASDRRAEKTSSIFRTPLVLAQVTPESQRAQHEETKIDETRAVASSEEREAARLGEMIVTTGTHIPGAETSSPLLVFDRTDFDKAGAATAQQFLATLPQNFGGGRNEDTRAQLPNVPNDFVYGSAVNLRGLGSASTLVLVDGRRSAVAGAAEYVDISMIPLSAVERIEVLTDGASAIYGSDAIGGVVNFVMRKEYQGAETRVRGGWTTQGGGEELQAAQTLGAGWASGRALLAYEYYERDPITAFQRDFTANLGSDNAILPGQKKQSVFLSARQEISESLVASGDASYSERDANDQIFDPFFPSAPNTFASDNQQYSSSLGISYAFGQVWEAELIGGISRNKRDSLILSPRFPTSDTVRRSESKMRYADAKLGGDLFRLPAGPIKLVLGGGYRREYYSARTEFPDLGVVTPGTTDDFDLSAAFVEMLIPVIAGADAGVARPRLTLSLAGRYEKYSNFGDTFNPKFGVSYAPTNALRFRASYGTSFKAPTVIQGDVNNNAIFATNLPTPTGPIRIIRLAGNNAGLDPETATTWTVGMDLAPQASRGFRAQVTYFDIDYEDRIESISAAQILQLTDPAFAGTRVVRGEIPDADFNAQVAAILSNPSGHTLFGCFGAPGRRAPCSEPATNFNAILDRRLLNLATTHDSGIDLTLGQRMESRAGTFDFDLNATYLFDFVRQFTVSAPAIDLVDTIFNPIDLRLRASAGWSRNGWSVTGWLNYSDSYTDNGVLPAAEASSWTTLDLNLSYNSGERFQSGWLENTVLTVNVSNLLDKDPPFINQTNGLGYDPANADPIVRVISISVSKAW